MERIVYAVEDAAVGMPDGSIVSIRRGQPYPADAPVVRRTPGFFSTDPTGVVESPVEQATAAPGERRSTRRG